VSKTSLKIVDSEPSYNSDEEASQYEVIKALNWYQSNKTEKDAAKYLSCDVKFAKNHTTHAWITRMRTRGFKFNINNEGVAETLKQKFEESRSLSKTKSVEIDENGNIITTNVVNLQERIAAKTDVFIGELEGMVDEYGHGIKSFNAYDWFVKNEVKPIHASKIINYFQTRAENLLKEVEGKDTREGYAGLGKAKIKSLLSVMAAIIKDAERLSQNAGKSRKPRKKKAVNFQKLASKVQFKEKDDSFKIQSVDPINIIGASQVWLFNIKSKRLALYVAEDDAGLFIKGSKIESFSANKSFAKTLRKPEKVLNNALNGGKMILRKLMDDITGKKFPLNGKINKDTVILRALK